ncbi:GNAT family N-acetyltransferase [Clostridium sporogenes]
MDIYIKQYKNQYRAVISELILDNSFVREDIIGCLDQWPQHGVIVEDECEVLAVGVFTGEYKQSSMTLYVKPSRRKEGIGSMVLKALEEKIKNAGVKEIVCDFKVNELEKSFLYKNGYKHWFHSNFMIYTGGKFTEDNYEITNYKDRDYDKCQKIFSEAFHKMRLSVGLESTLSRPSEKQKNEYKENAENIFVLKDNNQIVAVARLEGNEIDEVAVAVDKQGKGYGKNLVSYSVNKLLNGGFEKVILWVVEGNPAKFLYEKLGFKVERRHEFVIKNIK